MWNTGLSRYPVLRASAAGSAVSVPVAPLAAFPAAPSVPVAAPLGAASRPATTATSAAVVVSSTATWIWSWSTSRSRYPASCAAATISWAAWPLMLETRIRTVSKKSWCTTVWPAAAAAAATPAASEATRVAMAFSPAGPW